MYLLAQEVISSSIWMWILGIALATIIALVGFLGKLILNTMRDVSKELAAVRLDIAENMITWEKFGPVKRGMEADRDTHVKLALTEHVNDYDHNMYHTPLKGK